MVNYMVLAAAGATSGLTEGMKTAFTNALKIVQGDVTDMISTALPVGLAIMGLVLAIRIGIRFFKSVAN